MDQTRLLLLSKVPLFILTCAVLLTASTATAITYDIIFTSNGAVPSGTITFTNIGDSAPSSLYILDPASTAEYTLADDVNFPWNIGWNGPTPAFLTSPSGTGQQYILDTDTNIYMFFDNASAGPGTWDTNTPASGTYAFEAIPEPGTAALVALGAVALGLKRRRLALR